MFRQILATLCFAGIFSTGVLADDGHSGWTSFECGDHWLNVEIVLDPTQGRGVVNFDGDSQPRRNEVDASYQTRALDGSIEVRLLDSLGGAILLTPSSHRGQTLWWASLKYSSDANFNEMGSCNVNSSIN